MVDIDERIKDEWRDLGFYYDLEEIDNKKEGGFMVTNTEYAIL
jgi:hypothetical protein